MVKVESCGGRAAGDVWSGVMSHLSGGSPFREAGFMVDIVGYERYKRVTRKTARRRHAKKQPARENLAGGLGGTVDGAGGYGT